MRETILYEKLKDGVVRCGVCQRRCVIPPGKLGFCRTRKNVDGVLYCLAYNRVAAIHKANIERKPFFHFYPGTYAMSYGTFGCNFRCPGCQNWDIAHADLTQNPRTVRNITPSESVEIAIENECQGMSWTYNEPTVWFEWTLEGAKISREKGLYTCYVTNGFMTTEALDMIAPYMDGMRVDVKAFSAEKYMQVANVSNFEGILEIIKRAKHKWNIWVECITNVIPTYTDDEETLKGIARWIAEDLGPDTPWHVTRFHPHLKFSRLKPTAPQTLHRAREIGFESGLRYVYTGNLPGDPGEHTYCYNCNEKLILRDISGTYENRLVDKNRCPSCGTVIAGR